MNSKVSIGLLIAFFLAVGAVGTKLGEEKMFVNPDLPNRYAPNYNIKMQEAQFLKVLPKDRMDVIDKVIVFKPDRARELNEFELQGLFGENIDTKLFKGKVTMVYIWSSISAEARTELDGIVQNLKTFGDNRFQIFGISTKGTLEDTIKIMDDLGRPFPTAWLSGHSPVTFRFFPTSIFLDRQGRVRSYVAYPLTSEVRAKIIDRLLSEADTSSADLK